MSELQGRHLRMREVQCVDGTVRVKEEILYLQIWWYKMCEKENIPLAWAPEKNSVLGRSQVFIKTM